ncbi:MAG TPA: TerB family tellurite resistance protein, partial [Vicinamibacteria bacterium]
MLDSLRQLLDRTAAPERLTEEAREHALRLATGALLVEVARADGQVAVEERESMIAAMESGLGLAR